MTESIKNIIEYTKIFARWLIAALAVGIIGGVIGSFFHLCLDFVTEFRLHHSYIIYFLPLAALLIVAMYRRFRVKGNIDTNRVIKSVRENDDIPIVMVPLIFLGTAITHLFGGSAGREGAALQIGGGIGYNFARLLKLNKSSVHIITMAGMSSVFSALFGTPITAAVFSLEVISVGSFNFTGLLPCVIASSTAFYISSLFGITPVSFAPLTIETLSVGLVFKVIVLAIMCALVSTLFCKSIKHTEHYMKKLIDNPYIRGLVGGAIVVGLTLLVNTYDYNGAGMDVISRAISGQARGYDFILKIIFTAITISAGFKGGEIVPTFFIGATFGCAVASILGMDCGFAASIGLIAVFCGVVNCPVASIILSAEMFGAEGMVFFGIACAVSYLMSGHTGLYNTQKIVFSKLTAEQEDIDTK